MDYSKNIFNPLIIPNDGGSRFVFTLVVILILIIVYHFVSKRYSTSESFMSAGTVDQMFAKDAQDTAINSNIDNIASGNYALSWNEPTRITNTLPNRGSLIFPNDEQPVGIPSDLLSGLGKDVQSSFSPLGNAINNALVNQGENPMNLNGEVINGNGFGPNNGNGLNKNSLYGTNMNYGLRRKTCKEDPASCGSDSAGIWLNSDIVNPVLTSDQPEYVSLANGKLFYPSSYLADLYMLPNNDVNYPYAVMPQSNVV